MHLERVSCFKSVGHAGGEGGRGKTLPWFRIRSKTNLRSFSSSSLPFIADRGVWVEVDELGESERACTPRATEHNFISTSFHFDTNKQTLRPLFFFSLTPIQLPRR
jgi:hypothetical protein